MVAQRLDYDAWGGITSDSAPGFQPFGFAGGLFDRDTGLTHFGARDYDSASGRWLSKDPARAFHEQTSLFAAMGNSPTVTIDPSGLDAYILWDPKQAGQPIQHISVAVDATYHAPDVPLENRVVVQLDYSCGTLATGGPAAQSLCLISAPGIATSNQHEGGPGAGFYSVKQRIRMDREQNAEALSRLRGIVASPPRYTLGLSECQSVSEYVAFGPTPWSPSNLFP
jgi:RHS repeat-associated protein